MRWGWGEGLLCYALCELDAFTKEKRYLSFVEKYLDYYAAHPPVVDCSDTAAPGLASAYAYQASGKEEYNALTKKVIDYITHSEKIIDDLPNHFGNSKDAKSYPQSIWVDSLMMFSVFTAIYGKNNHDKEILDYAKKQPPAFAKYLMDKDDNLWYHSYWVKQKTHYPRRKLYWGRGNGWIVTSLPIILEYAGSDNPFRTETVEILKNTSEALLKYQREDGAYETVFNKVGKTYRELSATALIAGGWFSGIRQGILEKEKYLAPAIKAYDACINSIIYENGGVFFPEISRPTVPMKVIPYLWYRLMPRGRNWNYGVAALVLAAIEREKLRAEKNL